MKTAKDVTNLIGKTPLVQLNVSMEDNENRYFAKLEQFNPGASVKDRAALSMIEESEKKRGLRPGLTLIESTSGNTGISLAMIAAARGYHLIITMPETMSRERQEILKLFGAEVKLTPAHLGMRGAIELAESLHDQIKDSFLVRQFDNPDNSRAHELTTAKEILEDTEGTLDIFVSSVGTGGTITGTGKALKESNPSIKVVAVEPATSAVLSNKRPGPHMIQGIGAGFIPSILDKNLIDDVILVSDQEAFEWTKKLIEKEGLFVGISSGATACAAWKYSRKYHIKEASFVLIFPDTAERYLSLLTQNFQW